MARLKARCQLRDYKPPLSRLTPEDPDGWCRSGCGTRPSAASTTSRFSSAIVVTLGRRGGASCPRDVVECRTHDTAITGILCKTSGQIRRHVLFGLKMIGRVPAQKSFVQRFGPFAISIVHQFQLHPSCPRVQQAYVCRLEVTNVSRDHRQACTRAVAAMRASRSALGSGTCSRAQRRATAVSTGRMRPSKAGSTC